MKNLNLLIGIIIAWSSVVVSAGQTAQYTSIQQDWWNEQWIEPYAPKDAVPEMEFISVKGHQFITPDGQPIIFKGLSIADPDKVEKNGKWSKAHFEVIKNWGANLVRMPVHPRAVKERGMRNYLQLLDQAVDWCAELGIYLVIDWHSIGNLEMEMFQHPMYETTKRETYNFWKTIARHYEGVPTIAFYEIYNEPTLFNGTLGKCTWEEWKALVEDIVDIIYAHDKKVIPLVAGFNWAYDLRDIEYHPIAREGIAYVTHPYPGKCEPPREAHWEAHFGFLANRFPIVATELGYYFEGEEHLIEDGTYREAIIDYMDRKGISWCAWVFDPNWHPQMIKNYDYEPTHQGAFFRDVMLGKNAEKE